MYMYDVNQEEKKTRKEVNKQISGDTNIRNNTLKVIFATCSVQVWSSDPCTLYFVLCRGSKHHIKARHMYMHLQQ